MRSFCCALHLLLRSLSCPRRLQVHIPRGGGAQARKLEANIRSVEDEVELLQQFDHANIVRYLVRGPVGWPPVGWAGGLAWCCCWLPPDPPLAAPAADCCCQQTASRLVPTPRRAPLLLHCLPPLQGTEKTDEALNIFPSHLLIPNTLNPSTPAACLCPCHPPAGHREDG